VLTSRAARFNARAERQQPAQVIGIAPSSADQSIGDVVDEHRSEHLPATIAWYAQETVLIDGIRGADGHLVDGSNDIFDGPLPCDTPERGEQLTDTRRRPISSLASYGSGMSDIRSGSFVAAEGGKERLRPTLDIVGHHLAA
jgi:hypothetical protein